jgi:hypothetical protein
MQMITHSRVIATVLLVDMLALLMYNVSGMCVTGGSALLMSPKKILALDLRVQSRLLKITVICV